MKITLRLQASVGVVVLGAGIALGYIYYQSPSPKQVVSSAPTMVERNRAVQALARLPLRFEAGSLPGQFVARGAGYGLSLTPTAAGIAIPHFDKNLRPQPIHKRSRYAATQLQMRLLGANPRAQARGEEAHAGAVNYLTGNEPTKWRQNVPTFGKVKYQAVYPGIDLIYYGTGQQLEYDFVVAPGTTSQAIQMDFAGADQVEINPAGELVLTANASQLVQHKPVIYQEVNGRRRNVEGGYMELGENRIGFHIGDYDHALPLVIDPVLSYSTYWAGTAETWPSSSRSTKPEIFISKATRTPTDFPSSPGKHRPVALMCFLPNSIPRNLRRISSPISAAPAMIMSVALRWIAEAIFIWVATRPPRTSLRTMLFSRPTAETGNWGMAMRMWRSWLHQAQRLFMLPTWVAAKMTPIQQLRLTVRAMSMRPV